MSSDYRFAFDRGAAEDGDIVVTPQTVFDPARGCGFEPPGRLSKDEDKRDSLPGDYFIPAVPSFQVAVPDGAYIVTAVFGGTDGPSCTTVKAGPGRLMLQELRTAPGERVAERFAVYVEDGQLRLAFGGAAPAPRSVRIESAPGLPVWFLAGDSTVTDQPSGQYPYAGWGQMLPVFLGPGAAVSNYARSGRSTKSFIREGRLDAIWARIRPGDTLIIQFAHNDEKDNDGGTLPYTTYQEHLKRYTDGARERGASPVLVTPMHRRFFGEDGCIRNTHGEYIEAMKQFAGREGVPLLDLAERSRQLFERLGEEGTRAIFMWTRPGQYAGFPDGTEDNTHFQEHGGIEIARLVAEELRDKLPGSLGACLR